MKEQLLSFLPENFSWREHIQVFDSIDSTNTYLKSLALRGAPHGTAVLARQQTGGRGRLGRRFHSPEGAGIYLSVLLRPSCEPAELMHLTCAVGVAMCDAVEAATGLRPGIKWTNDLILEDKKLGGILVELVSPPEGGLCAILGIGINCTQQAGDFPPELRPMATSLAMAQGQPPCQPQLAASMLRSLEQMARQLLSQQAAVLDRYRRDCVTLGRPVSVVTPLGSRHARAIGVDDRGGLIVEYKDGRQETVTSGEVSIRGMYGYV